MEKMSKGRSRGVRYSEMKVQKDARTAWRWIRIEGTFRDGGLSQHSATIISEGV